MLILISLALSCLNVSLIKNLNPLGIGYKSTKPKISILYSNDFETDTIGTIVQISQVPKRTES